MKKSVVTTFLKYLVFASFGIGLFYYVFQGQQEVYRAQCMQDPNQSGNCSLWDKLLQDIKQLNWVLMSLVMIGFIVSNLMRARKWVLMLEPLQIKAGLWETYWSVHLGYFANLALPRMGELARAGALSRRLKAPLEKVLGTIISDRILDLVVLLGFTLLAFLIQTNTLYQFLSKQASISVWNLLLLGGIGLLILLFLIFLFRTDRFYHPIIEKIKTKLKGFKDGVMSILHSKHPLELIILSIGIWFMYFTMTLMGLKAFQPTAHLSIAQGMTVFVIGSLGMIVPTPGGIGPFHFLTMSALSIFGISSIDGFSYANLSFIVIQVITISLFGILALVLLSRTKKT
jgi:glycosyltransferase 2 family protein